MDITKNITHNQFDDIKHLDKSNKEYWYARELMPLLQYTEWRNFHKVINKAKTSIKNSYQQNQEHFVEISKKINIASGTNKQAVRSIKDYKLTRYACYVIAQNGDSAKLAIAQAQSYFAIQTRKQEIQENNKKLLERYKAREKLKETEKKFSQILRDHGVNGPETGEIRSAGDATLFGSRTAKMKKKLAIPQNKPLADHLPTITLKAKDLAAEMTAHQTEKKKLFSKDPIKEEHIHNNREIRKLLTENGIFPEELPKEEDIKKLEETIGDNLNDQDDLDVLLEEPKEVLIDLRKIQERSTLLEIADIIKKHPGETKVKIFYGNPKNFKVIKRKITLTKDVFLKVQEYLIYD